MIHSMSGGVLDSDERFTVVKAQSVVDGRTGFYLASEFIPTVGDRVVVETRGGGIEEVLVARVDKNVSSKSVPFSTKRALKVLRKA